jgi:nucleoside-diphosphate-sugar epimerase
MENESTALVTGATGFVGSRLAGRLVADGWKVHAVVRPQSDVKKVEAYLKGAVLEVYDGTYQSLSAAVEKSRPRVVFHLASHFLAEHKPDDIRPLVESNLTFSVQLVEAMAAHSVFRLVNTGTSWEYYQERDEPVCLYAATKRAFGEILSYYLGAFSDMRVVTLKLFDTYGSDDPRPKLFNALRKASLGGEPLAMSPGEQRIDLVHVDDVVSAFLCAASRLADPSSMAGRREEFAVSSGRPIRLKELAALYGRVVGREVPIRWGARPYRPREVMTPWALGYAPPGWVPRIGLEDGIRRMEGAG